MKERFIQATRETLREGNHMIIGISGKAQSGKDTIGIYLEKRYGFIRLASADLLKEITSRYLGWDGIKDDRGRRFLQEIGCAVRAYNEDFWISAVLRKISPTLFSDNIGLDFVITDVRFKNEAKILKERGAILFRVERDGIIKYDHVSEVELDDYRGFDFIVTNIGSVDDLYKKIDEIREHLVRRAG